MKMLRRTRRVLTPEEAERKEHEETAGAASAGAKPSLLSRLRLRRSAGEARTTVDPAKRMGARPEVDDRDPSTATSTSDRVGGRPSLPDRSATVLRQVDPSREPEPPATRPMPPPAAHRGQPTRTATQAIEQEPHLPEASTNRKKPIRPIHTADDVRRRYIQEPPAED
jgi:hypothetical protein